MFRDVPVSERKEPLFSMAGGGGVGDGVGSGVAVGVGAALGAVEGVLGAALSEPGVVTGALETSPVCTGGVVLSPPSSVAEQERSTMTSAITMTMSISRAKIIPAGLFFLRLFAMRNHLSMYHTSLDDGCPAKFPTILA